MKLKGFPLAETHLRLSAPHLGPYGGSRFLYHMGGTRRRLLPCLLPPRSGREPVFSLRFTARSGSDNTRPWRRASDLCGPPALRCYGTPLLFLAWECWANTPACTGSSPPT